MVQNTRKRTEPDFPAKLPLAQIWAKRAKNGPKMDFFKSSRSFKLLHFQNAITSKPFDHFLIFFA